MKGLFLIFHGFSPHHGISKKIGYQVRALKQCGIEMELCYLTIDPKGVHKRLIDDHVINDYGTGITAKIKRRIGYRQLQAYILKNNLHFLYVRSAHNANPFLIRMLKTIRGKGVRAVLEIPTYPYDTEYRHARLADRIGFAFDKLFRSRLGKQFDRIVTFSPDDFIFGTPAVRISNGVAFEQVELKKYTKSAGTSLRLIGVAEIHFWHGFDRVLEGLGIYYRSQQPTEVFFDIVGDGVPAEVSRLKAIARGHKLDRYVTFHGPKSGKDLDLLFEDAQMGIASLGRHRSGITHIKPLKNREYAARGIPFVYAETDDDFEHMPYIMKAPADDTPLNIHELINFYFSKEFVPSKIRNSIAHLSWYHQMKQVIDAVFPNQTVHV